MYVKNFARIKPTDPVLKIWRPVTENVPINELPLARALYKVEVPIIDPKSVENYKRAKKKEFLKRKKMEIWEDHIRSLWKMFVTFGLLCLLTVSLKLTPFSTHLWLWSGLLIIWFARVLTKFRDFDSFVHHRDLCPDWHIHPVADPANDGSWVWQKSPLEAKRLARYVCEVVPNCSYEIHTFYSDPFLFVRRGIESYAIFVWDDRGDFPYVEL